MKIAINGSGVAGPALAYWLQRAGHETLLIEKSPRLRRGGYIIDFWGVGYDIAEKMGLIPRLKELGYRVGEVRLVDRHGRRTGGFDTEVFQRMTGDRFTSLPRSDLSATLYEALRGKTEILFDDSIARIEDAGKSVRLSFDKAPAREVDLVVGADGLHSRVRRLAFGPQERFEVSLGYHVAAFQAKGYGPRDELVYLSHGIAGRQVSRFSMREDRTLFLFVFRDEYLEGEPATDEKAQKAAVRRVFAPAGWECPRILDFMDEAEDFYFDRVSQIRMPRWTAGRVALVGDAAACVSLLAGEGTGLALAEAYVLAAELKRNGADHAAAFARYEDRLMPFLKRKQQAAAGFASVFAPRTELGLKIRDLGTGLLRFPWIADRLVGGDLRDDVELPDF